MKFEGSFDVMTAFAALYLWLIFTYLNSLLSCDIQRLIHNNMFIKHMLGLIAFYFLFTVLDQDGGVSVGINILKAVIIYLLFIRITKTTWYFPATAIVILFIDQILKNHISYLKKKDPSKDVSAYEKARFGLEIALISIVTIGFMYYLFIKRKQYKEDFSWIKFAFGSVKCKGIKVM